MLPTTRVSPAILLILVCGAGGQTVPQTSDDAVKLYHEASHAIVIDSPSASNLAYPAYPPFGSDWDTMATSAWTHDGETRRLAHLATSVDAPNWRVAQATEMTAMNDCRAVANNLADAAEYQHVNSDEMGAIQTLDDLLHLTTLLKQDFPREDHIRPLVAVGIDAVVSYRTMLIASNVHLTDDPHPIGSLQVGSLQARSLQPVRCRQFISELLKQRSPQEQMVMQAPFDQEQISRGYSEQKMRETISRSAASRIAAAMSLACHLFQFDQHRWPTSLAELVPGYLPIAPLDFWGDGKQTFGYVLIKSGLPDGGERPLIYFRCNSKDGLFYRTDRPEYGFYFGDGTAVPQRQQKQGGQFYDVAAWVPNAEQMRGPTTRPLDHLAALGSNP